MNNKKLSDANFYAGGVISSCPECNNVINTQDEACSKCGLSLSEIRGKCYRCQNEYILGHNYCSKCKALLFNKKYEEAINYYYEGSLVHSFYSLLKVKNLLEYYSNDNNTRKWIGQLLIALKDKLKHEKNYLWERDINRFIKFIDLEKYENTNMPSKSFSEFYKKQNKFIFRRVLCLVSGLAFLIIAISGVSRCSEYSNSKKLLLVSRHDRMLRDQYYDKQKSIGMIYIALGLSGLYASYAIFKLKKEREKK